MGMTTDQRDARIASYEKSFVPDVLRTILADQREGYVTGDEEGLWFITERGSITEQAELGGLDYTLTLRSADDGRVIAESNIFAWGRPGELMDPTAGTGSSTTTSDPGELLARAALLEQAAGALSEMQFAVMELNRKAAAS